MAEVPTNACWEANDARVILATEALERNDAVFLATHSPTKDFEIGGNRAGDIAAPTEHALLDALSAPSTRHAFCVVEGEPGSGKSHLIRWLKVGWPDDEPLAPLLIQRLDGSLQGTLQQLQRVLPEEHQHLFDMVGRPQDLTLAGRARVFHTNLALALHPDHFANPLDDAQWCDQFRLAELIGDKALLDQWKAPERIIELLSGKKGKRDQELARFNLEDMAELEQLLRPLRPPAPRAVRFKNQLKKEAQAIRQMSRQDLLNPSGQEEFRGRFEFSYKLVDALNERHNNAVQNVLGISTDGLKELFLRLRRELRDRRFVLLLEDITAWEGVDRQLIDVLVTNVETRNEQDLCPMVSVVGLTPAYFENKSFQANYRQRITHHIRLGRTSGTHDYQDVSALRTGSSQVAFAAKYLRATRAGVDRLTEWNGGPEPLPNRCDSCRYKDPCHNAFGHYDGIGLFPFTAKSITNLYGILRDPQHAATYQTPRGMLQGVLSPTLQHPWVLDAGEYPGAEIETDLIAEDDRRLFGQIDSVLNAQIEDDGKRSRMRRLIAYWGSKDGASTFTLADEDGSLIYGGVRRAIYEAFSLPWLGADTADARATETEQTSGTGSKEGSGSQKTEQESATPAGSRTGPKGGESGRGKPGTGGTARLSNAQLRAVQQDIARWSEGKNPQKPGELNRLAFEIVSHLNWGNLGISPWLRSRMFTKDTVILRDTKPARLQHFVLEKEPWVKEGIEAYQALRIGTENLAPQAVEGYRRAYVTMQRKLGAAVLERVRQRLPGLEKGETWDISRSAVEVLLTRAWLRGNVSPTGRSWEQWQVVIRDEADVVSNPQDRVPSWNDLVNASSGIHGVLRTLLRQWLALPQFQPDPEHQKPETSLALVHNDLVASVIKLSKTFRVSELPTSVKRPGEKFQELERLADVAGKVHQRLRSLPRYEIERLVASAQAVERMSRQSSLREHIKRVDGVVEEIANYFPHNVAQPVQDWRTAKKKLESQGFLSTEGDNPGFDVETFMDRVSDNDVPNPEDFAQSLSWTLSAPSGHLRTVQTGFETAERVVAQLLEYVEEYLEGTSDAGGTLDDIHKAGARIRVASDDALHGLEIDENE